MTDLAVTPPSATVSTPYRLRVVAILCLGYLLFFGTLALVMLATGLTLVLIPRALILINFFFLLLPLLFLILRALVVRLPRPQGLELTCADAPRLFALIDAIPKASDVARIDEVLLTRDFNAGVVQYPEFGFLGWHTNYLLLGVPLMAALSPPQFEAVLGHEFGHLGNADGRLGNWVYRMRRIWLQLDTELASKGAGVLFAGALQRLVHRYVHFFNAYSFPLARRQEFAADRASAQRVGAATTGEALVSVALKERCADRAFWPQINRLARRQPEPPPQLSVDYARWLAADWQGSLEPHDLPSLLHAPTHDLDTHPALRERLAALGVGAAIPAPLETSAAEHFLGPSDAPLFSVFNAAWRRDIGTKWQEIFHLAEQQRAELAKLAAQPSVSLREQCRRIFLIDALDGPAAALPLAESVAGTSPDDAEAQFLFGRLTLATLGRSSPVEAAAAGLGALERAIALSPSSTLPAAAVAVSFFHRVGRPAEAEPWIARLHQRGELERCARAERGTLLSTDELTRVTLEDAAAAALREWLAGQRSIRRAWLAGKKVKYLPEWPCYVLVLEVSWRRRSSRGSIKRLARTVVDNMPLAGARYVIVPRLGFDRTFRTLRKIRRVSGSLFYERGGRVTAASAGR